MNRYVFIAALGATLVGCSTTNTQSTATVTDDDLTYTTGSRIGRLDSNETTVTIIDDKNSIKDVMRPKSDPLPAVMK